MKKYMFLIMASLSLVFYGCSAESNSNENNTEGEPDFISILGASDGGTFFLLANGMANLFNDELDGDFSAQTTSGTNDIIQKVNGGEGEIGFAQASMAAEAVEGEGYFDGNPQENFVGLSYMYPNVMHIVVNKKAGIKEPADIEGKTVGVGEPGGGPEVDSLRLLEALDLNVDEDIDAEHVTGSQGSDMLRNNQMDALIMPGGLGASNTVEILSSDKFEVIPVPEDLIENLIDINPAYLEIEIPAETYPNQDEAIKTYAEANWLYARKDLSDDFIYDFLEALFDNQDKMLEVHDSMENLKLENSQDNKLVPLHPGAEKFFEDNDVDIDD